MLISATTKFIRLSVGLGDLGLWAKWTTEPAALFNGRLR